VLWQDECAARGLSDSALYPEARVTAIVLQFRHRHEREIETEEVREREQEARRRAEDLQREIDERERAERERAEAVSRAMTVSNQSNKRGKQGLIIHV
jgi:hypothetical protein